MVAWETYKKACIKKEIKHKDCWKLLVENWNIMCVVKTLLNSYKTLWLGSNSNETMHVIYIYDLS